MSIILKANRIEKEDRTSFWRYRQMTQMKEITLTSFINNAVKRAKEMGTKQFISWTKQMNEISLLDMFKYSERFDENRLFWTNSKRDFMLLGFGTAKKIVAEKDRFEQLEQLWDEFIAKASIYNPYRSQGTGVTALGGMNFDPLRKREPLWSKFPMSELTIPSYLLVYDRGKYYATVNCYVDQKDDAETVIEKINQMEQHLEKGQNISNGSSSQIVERLEKDSVQWKESVRKAVDIIRAKEAEKIVLARELRLKLSDCAQISFLIEKLMETQRQSYVFAYEQGENCFIGASPERLVQIQGDALLSTCLAGTAPRGENEDEDRQIANDELLYNDKNREEHEHVVQMIHSSISPFCHDINIPNQPVILTLRDLQHLYTPVTATLNEGVSVFQLIEVLHPTPALGGVPTNKALQFIREEEQFDRGWYGAPLGWLDSNRNSEFAVAIRSGLVQKDEVSLFAGCGVMADSDPEQEYEETAVKFLPMLTILEEHE